MSLNFDDVNVKSKTYFIGRDLYLYGVNFTFIHLCFIVYTKLSIYHSVVKLSYVQCVGFFEFDFFYYY